MRPPPSGKVQSQRGLRVNSPTSGEHRELSSAKPATTSTGGVVEDTPKNHLLRAARVAREVFARYPEHVLDEQAGPAYLEGLALSRWLFWRRLRKVIGLLPMGGDACIDFGCGFGILLPLLARRFTTVYGVDLRPALGREFLERWQAHYGESQAKVEIITALDDLDRAGSIDLILALDVLEHVDDLPTLLEKIHVLLTPGGTLLVSAPTENFFYKLGRRVVGFSGEYHVRDAYNVRRTLEHRFEVRVAGRISFPITLFLIFECKPKPRR